MRNGTRTLPDVGADKDDTEVWPAGDETAAGKNVVTSLQSVVETVAQLPRRGLLRLGAERWLGGKMSFWDCRSGFDLHETHEQVLWTAPLRKDCTFRRMPTGRHIERKKRTVQQDVGSVASHSQSLEATRREQQREPGTAASSARTAQSARLILLRDRFWFCTGKTLPGTIAYCWGPWREVAGCMSLPSGRFRVSTLRCRQSGHVGQAPSSPETKDVASDGAREEGTHLAEILRRHPVALRSRSLNHRVPDDTVASQR